MSGRTIAIGDIHGCLSALRTVLDSIEPRPDDTIVTLGDYVDRGPESRGVLQALIELGHRCLVMPLLGNHDQLFLQICLGEQPISEDWLRYGGDATLAAYGNQLPRNMPDEHIAFLQRCRLFYETSTHFFVHGNYAPELPLARQSPTTLLWESLKTRCPGPHVSGKSAVVGHTSQKDGEILDLGHIVCIDTFCYGSGWLTAMDVVARRIWQADKFGSPRRCSSRPR